eukprot:COSAG02_NODE_55899_length_288_cov_0.777778_1_plen_76_part_10
MHSLPGTCKLIPVLSTLYGILSVKMISESVILRINNNNDNTLGYYLLPEIVIIFFYPPRSLIFQSTARNHCPDFYR